MKSSLPILVGLAVALTLPACFVFFDGPAAVDGSATTVKIPLLGPLDVKGYSLPALAVMLGLIDGFNPCAMWAWCI